MCPRKGLFGRHTVIQSSWSQRQSGCAGQLSFSAQLPEGVVSVNVPDTVSIRIQFVHFGEAMSLSSAFEASLPTSPSGFGFGVIGGSDQPGECLRISAVRHGSIAARQGMQEGDIIKAING